MKQYLTTLLTEKNINLNDCIEVKGVYGYTYNDLIKEIISCSLQEQAKIKKL